MATLLTLQFGLALALAASRARAPRWAFAAGALAPLSTLAFALANTEGALRGDETVGRVEWVPGLDLSLSFTVDGYSLLFMIVIGAAGSLIFWHASRYFAPSPRVTVFAANMTAFSAAMTGLVTADHLLTVFVFWEITTISSYLLIGFDDESPRARTSALHAALVTGGGGLAMLGGLVLIGMASGSFTISEIVDAPPTQSLSVSVGWGLVLVGAAAKSAQFPLHGWLPGAMAAPTPASAFLHSATMVKAGIFLVGKLGVAAVASTDWWQPAVLGIGLVTMVVGGWQSLRQHDLKLLLAYGTVSQLGLLFLLVGSGDQGLVFGGLALLLAHAAFKAALFMTVGTIDHEAGTRDIRELVGLRRAMPVLFVVTCAAAASMAAIPLTFGFVAKEAAFDALVSGFPVVLVAVALASAITVAYTGRFVLGAFGRVGDGDPLRLRPRFPLVAAPAALAGAGLLLGVAPGWAKPLVVGAVETATGSGAAGKLVAWPGLVPALAWSLASFGGGLVLVWRHAALDRALERVHRSTRRLPTAMGTFQAAVTGLLRVADRTTGFVQNGSLPAYVATILLVAVVAPITAAIAAGGVELGSPSAGGSLEILAALFILSGAVAVAFVRHRFAAVILLGAVGYGVAAAYAIAGGPDLGITQLLVETLAIGLFALVLRHLPAQFGPSTGRAGKALVAALVSGFVFIGGLAIQSTPPPDSVSTTYVRDAEPEAAGLNVVNVILVDFRGLDTLGEITVLVIAAVGAAGLVAPILGRRSEADRAKREGASP